MMRRLRGHNCIGYRVSARFEGTGAAKSLIAAGAAATAAARLKEKDTTALADGVWLRVYTPSEATLTTIVRVLDDILCKLDASSEVAFEVYDSTRGHWIGKDVKSIAQFPARVRYHREAPSSWGADAERDRVEVRFECQHRSEAKEFAGTLSHRGFVVHHHSSYVFVFADDAASAQNLARELSLLAPPSARCFIMSSGSSTLII
ncbi:MAG: hypothetical protein ACYDHN_03670 [Solirubrobacteraceae bacterium]